MHLRYASGRENEQARTMDSEKYIHQWGPGVGRVPISVPIAASPCFGLLQKLFKSWYDDSGYLPLLFTVISHSRVFGEDDYNYAYTIFAFVASLSYVGVHRRSSLVLYMSVFLRSTYPKKIHAQSWIHLSVSIATVSGIALLASCLFKFFQINIRSLHHREANRIASLYMIDYFSLLCCPEKAST